MFRSDADIERIGCGLLDRSLPKAEWTHGAHFAAAIWLLARRPDINAAKEMPDFIRGFNASVGGENTDTAGYHETITQASLRATADFLRRQPPNAPLHVVHRDLMASVLGKPDWLMIYWSRPVLFSVEARRGWVEPDIAPLPF